MRNVDQSSFRVLTEPNPQWCARAFCNIPRKKTATHTVTLAGKTFHVCSDCARRYESVRSAKVEKIATEVKCG